MYSKNVGFSANHFNKLVMKFNFDYSESDFLHIEDYTYVSRKTLTSETRLGSVLIVQYTRVNVY